MSGHSKWSTIKHKKAAADAKRGKVFSKLSKEITIAAKEGGGDADMNPRLRSAILAAKAVNMPNDNIDRAVKKGTGELPGVSYEEVVYEGYGPAGVGLIIEVLTDNRNRAAGEVRSTLDKRGGTLAGSGAVAWQFSKKGYIAVGKDKTDEETLFLAVTDAGAEDMQTGEDAYEITTPYDELEAVRKALEEADIEPDSAELTMLPESSVTITSEKEAAALLRLIDALEELDDVQNVYANFDIDDDIMEKVAAE
jgi:YebC/PmpR family DNA-binding regulatory protein